jgi:hypothetical protein
MFLYTLFCMQRQVDFLILKTRPHTQELSLSANMYDENVSNPYNNLFVVKDINFSFSLES